MQPNFVPVNESDVPQALRDLPRWAPWQGAWNVRRGKWDKIPVSPRNLARRLSTAHPERWTTYAEAMAALKDNPGKCHGVGLVLTGLAGFVGIDLDGCVDRDTGAVASWAQAIVDQTGGYAERSPSGKGLRIFVHGEVEGDFTNHGKGVEVYAGGHPRFLTVTGAHLPGTPAQIGPARPGSLTWLTDAYREKPSAEKGAVGELPDFGTTDAAAVLERVRPELPPRVLRVLAGEFEAGDRSRHVAAAAHALAGAGLTEGELMAVLLASPGPMGVGLEHRRGEHDRAIEYLWRHHGAPALERASKAGGVVEFDDLSDADDAAPPAKPSLSALELSALRKDPSQDAVAIGMRKLFAGQFLFAHQFGHWMQYDGTRWLADPAEHIREMVRRLARQLNTGEKRGLGSVGFYQGVVQILKHDPAFSALGTEFDADTNLLNTPAGTVDLRTGKMLPHDPVRRLSKRTSVAPNPTGGQLFTSTLYDICEGDLDLMHFHQLSLGAMLSGAREGHWMLFWFGAGRNGKNLLADLVFDVLGDYATKLPSAALMNRAKEDHPATIATLTGRRLALASEVRSDMSWNESLIKELTGDATLTARFMRQDPFTFERTFKILVLGNHRPQLREADGAMRARMKLVPFPVSFEGRENPDLPRLLREEAGYVLHWLIEGHRLWRANGMRLPPCEAIEAASRDYFASQSTVAAWFAECCERVADDGRAGRAWLTAGTLYGRYADWKKSRNELPVSMTRWSEDMQRMGLRKVTSGGVRFVGVALHPGEADFAEISV